MSLEAYCLQPFCRFELGYCILYMEALWLAFQAMPLIIVVSVISSILMYLKILPLIMRGFSFILEKTIEVGGAVGEMWEIGRM